MSVAILHHNDLDGILSGVIAEKYIAARDKEEPTLFLCDYGKIPKSFDPDNYHQIYVIDFSDDDLFNNEKIRNKIIWIDHHITAIENKYKVNQYCMDGVAACRLALQFFTNIDYAFLEQEDYIERRVTEPLFVTLAGEYDIWDKDSVFAKALNFAIPKSYEIIRQIFNDTFKLMGPFEFLNKGMNPSILGPTKETNILTDLINRGNGAIDYIKNTPVRLEGGLPINLLGYDGRAFNTDSRSSLIYNLKEDEDFILVWNVQKDLNIITCSVYSDKIDVSYIAKHYKGGGHKGAAGFRIKLNNLLEILENEQI